MQVLPWAKSTTPGRESDSTKSLHRTAVLPWGSGDDKKPNACTNRQCPTTLKANVRLCTPNLGDAGWRWNICPWPQPQLEGSRQPLLSAIDFPYLAESGPSLENGFSWSRVITPMGITQLGEQAALSNTFCLHTAADLCLQEHLPFP